MLNHAGMQFEWKVMLMRYWRLEANITLPHLDNIVKADKKDILTLQWKLKVYLNVPFLITTDNPESKNACPNIRIH